MSSQLVLFSVDIIAVFAALLFASQVLLTSPKEFNARILALICFDSACAVLLSRQELSWWIPSQLRIDVGVLQVPFHVARNLTPGLLMILCYWLFQDEKKFPRWLLVAFAVQVSMETIVYGFQPNASQYAALRSIPALLELFFIGGAFYWLFKGWRADLVEARRQLRLIFLMIVGAATFIDILLRRLAIPWGSNADFYIHTAMSAFMTIVFVGALSTLRSGAPSYINPFRDEAAPKEPVAERTEDHDATVAAILSAFRDQHIYRDGELTIASLAVQLQLPEYRIRKAIHEQLGYRNFNALLHDYRIAEACRDLGDPKKDHLPILTIALTVGYNSINPFNRAFRDAKGMTPSAFRAQTQGKSTPIPTN